jgi:proteasome lid subunit RPN8/RPN11
MADAIRIRAGILEQMFRHACSERGIECCGLLAGRGGIVTNIFPAENALRSPTSYEIAPKELFHLFRRMREEGLEHLGQYHSHPTSENFPSASDIEQSGYPDQVYMIVSPRADAAKAIRAFYIRNATVCEVEITAIET